MRRLAAVFLLVCARLVGGRRLGSLPTSSAALNKTSESAASNDATSSSSLSEERGHSSWSDGRCTWHVWFIFLSFFVVLTRRTAGTAGQVGLDRCVLNGFVAWAHKTQFAAAGSPLSSPRRTAPTSSKAPAATTTTFQRRSLSCVFLRRRYGRLCLRTLCVSHTSRRVSCPQPGCGADDGRIQLGADRGMREVL